MTLLIPTTHKHIRPSHASPKVVTSQATFGAWLEQHGTPVNTSKSYQADLRVFVRWFEIHNYPELFDPRLLASGDLRAWRFYSIETEKVMPATWNRRRASMAVYMRYLAETGLNKTDILRDVKRVEGSPLAPRWINQPEFHRLQRWMEHAAENEHTALRQSIARRNVAMVALMAYAGLREHEVLKLTAADLQISDRTGKVRLYGKGQKYREVKLVRELRHWLEEYLSNAPKQPEERLFPIKPRQLQNIVAEVGEECGIENFTPHRLRHCVGKKLDLVGAPQSVSQKILGHASARSTEVYQQAGEDELEEWLEAASYVNLPGGKNG